MRRILTLLAAVAASLAPAVASADDHLVSPRAAQQRLAQARSQRQLDLLVAERVLTSAPAARAAEELGVSLARVRSAVPTLSDQELRDLARRAAPAGADPAAGHFDDQDLHDVAVVSLIVVGVVILLSAAH